MPRWRLGVPEIKPFREMPLINLEENLYRQVKEIQQHPKYRQELPTDANLLPPSQQLEFLDLVAREEALHYLREEFRRRRGTIPPECAIPLPTRIITDPGWRKVLLRLPVILARWRDEFMATGQDGTDFVMPDAVEGILRTNFPDEAHSALFPMQGESAPARGKPTLSDADQTLYKELTHEAIATTPNRQLWKANLSRLGLRSAGYDAFRSRLHRIRKSLNLPSSESLSRPKKKSVQP